MGREASPALSESEFDISRALVQDGGLDSDAELDMAQNTAAGGGEMPDLLGDSEDEQEAAFIAATQVKANRKNESAGAKKAGAFQTMGLNANLLKAISRKGFTVPTPIQRKTVPLILDGQDVVGMARTGSGKTAAFVIPMIEKLKSHSAKVGARAIVLSPSRELALQTLKVVKELGKGTDLRTTLLVGGDSLEEQFSSMASNPDIIIATPGRFEHLKVEMGLELSSVRYVVFDEADRLFEMGFAAQLHEIMYSLPSSRQTLLFSATLPKSLVEFARAGLQEPKLVRLDAESKIAPGLESAFFTVKRAEKEGALLHILQNVIGMPTGAPEVVKKAKEQANGGSKKRKRSGGEGVPANETPSPHSTVIFAATKHHVEYLAALLKAHNYATSYVYGSLDQTARKMQVLDFRSGLTNILVVTDVAARGLDIPILANVINYDFPSQPKIFVHRVGRTARAGKTGWAYSLITGADMPYLLDLQLFLGRKLVLGRGEKSDSIFKDAIVVGSMVRDKMERCVEEVGKLLNDDEDLAAMRDVAAKGEKQYVRTRNSASAESVKRAKQIASDGTVGTNMLFENDTDNNIEQARLDMLAKVSGFKPQETVFEIGKRGGANDETADLIRKQRQRIERKQNQKAAKQQKADEQDVLQHPPTSSASFHTAPEEQIGADQSDDELVITQPEGVNMDEASDSELELTFTAPPEDAGNKRKRSGWQDQEHFMSYTPSTINMAEDRGYGVHSGGTNDSHFLNQAKDATMDLANDENSGLKEASKPGMRWDKKGKKYVSRANDIDGSKGAKYITGESGQKIAASFKSGRFDAWRKANKVERMPRVGEMERANAHFAASGGGPGKRFKHKQERAPKDADKYRDDYEVRKKKVAAAREKRVGRFAEGKGKNELKGVEDVRKARKLKERRKEKNARPSRRK
ncbi:ATP-dependent RNA helicase dbp10 [Teratosphaeria destructans]|uniref:RNA helicase n=1 Tax=Teratosphaeria destructans TaxID=418781 RepID=A0A9W7W2Z3_9PEZI|nr:ATP-dependent RNA helicase dbp10 [Teratosphaeria destructans]